MDEIEDMLRDITVMERVLLLHARYRQWVMFWKVYTLVLTCILARVFLDTHGWARVHAGGPWTGPDLLLVVYGSFWLRAWQHKSI